MSGSTSRRNCSTMAIRNRTELMFQETIFTPVHLGGAGRAGKVGRQPRGRMHHAHSVRAEPVEGQRSPSATLVVTRPSTGSALTGEGDRERGASWAKPMTSDELCPPAALGRVLRQCGASRPTQKGPRSGGMERGPTWRSSRRREVVHVHPGNRGKNPGRPTSARTLLGQRTCRLHEWIGPIGHSAAADRSI